MFEVFNSAPENVPPWYERPAGASPATSFSGAFPLKVYNGYLFW